MQTLYKSFVAFSYWSWSLAILALWSFSLVFNETSCISGLSIGDWYIQILLARVDASPRRKNEARFPHYFDLVIETRSKLLHTIRSSRIHAYSHSHIKTFKHFKNNSPKGVTLSGITLLKDRRLFFNP
jgi:hypothetical protein